MNNQNPQLDLISKLVAERLTNRQQASLASQTLSKKQRQWNKLKLEPVYLLKLTVRVGVQTLRLSGLHLGINPEVMQLLEDTAKGGYRANTSQRLKDAAHKLQARQKIIYNRYTVLSEPFRLVHEASLPDALEAIDLMQQEAQELRQSIVAAHEEEFTAFLSWAHQVLTQAHLEPKALSAALTYYADAYPTQEDVEQCLQVVVEGPIKIPSLIEDAQAQVTQAQQILEEEALKIEQSKLALIRRSQETLEQTLLSTLYDAQTRSRDEAYGKLAELLSSMTCSQQEPTLRTIQKWQTLQQRLETLTQYDPSLEPIVQKAGLIQHLFQNDKQNLQEIQVLMDDFRMMLKERVKEESSSAGIAQLTKALTFDADYTELLKQLETLADSPSPEEFHKLKGKLAAMDALLRIRSKSLKQKWEQAENAVRKQIGLEERPTEELKEAINNLSENDEDSELKQPINGFANRKTTTPYDLDAGF
ncbi:hypothetical protein [Chlorogloeopsis sp. ULAP02]|uniref:hypothetical protein n=1 Tax=Chlorogloeopsis sp. ULAP02 TaxID=3107926 RepID=UPI003135B891